MEFEKLIIICDKSSSVPKTRIVVNGIDFSDSATSIKFCQKAGDVPKLLLEIGIEWDG